MRSPGRFLKTVWAIGIGIAASITVMGIISTANGIVRKLNKQYRYYPVYYEQILEPYQTIDEVQSSLPGVEALERISDMEEVTEAKQIYSSMVQLADWEEFYSHYTDAYLEQTIGGDVRKRLYEARKEDDWEVSDHLWSDRMMTEIACYGYDEEDLARLETVLIDGTLDVSENGVVLINSGQVAEKVEAEKVEEESDYWMPEFQFDGIEVMFTDYKVGDTVSLIDMEKLRSMVDKEMEEFREKYEQEHGSLEDSKETRDAYSDACLDERLLAVTRCREQLAEEGAYRIYTIEGIVSRDENRYRGEDVVAFVMPLANYYAVSGTDESMMTGMQYHFDRFPVNKFLRVSGYHNMEDDVWYGQSLYVEYMQMLEGFKNGSRGIMFFVIFVVTMSAFNIINTTAGNLHIRKKEMAQLRVIGVSKTQLMKMIMLEGVITTIAANGLGIVLGVAVHLGAFGPIYKNVLGIEYRFPLVTAILGVLISTLLLRGSVYVPLRGMKMDMAGDLATGGE